MKVDTTKYRELIEEKLDYLKKAYGEPVQRETMSLIVMIPDLEKLLDVYEAASRWILEGVQDEAPLVGVLRRT